MTPVPLTSNQHGVQSTKVIESYHKIIGTQPPGKASYRPKLLYTIERSQWEDTIRHQTGML